MGKSVITERKRAMRCAVYTRKSSEEGLEQEFNSLDAQREACEAYIKSQKHEGWEAIASHYDDGGFSGGTMERPALKLLLEDIKAGKVDVVVVYKVDRLTRSLADFVRIVEMLDRRSVSFVSVTQQFNTTSSMGRLTLNVLLSFAQFEREVTGERIRDKIAASKKKGMWMGGLPPLGYDVRERKLVVNEDEAKTVRHIFQRYLELSSVRLLKQELDVTGIVSKARTYADGRPWGSLPLTRGAIYLILQNRMYLGEITHKGKNYAGEHSAIIEPTLWAEVQNKLKDNRVERANGQVVANPSLLAGLVHDDQGVCMTPSHAVRGGKRYRYYVSRPLITEARATAPSGRRIPAGDIEGLVATKLCGMLSDPVALLSTVGTQVHGAARQKELIDAGAGLAARWPGLQPSEQRAVLRGAIARIDILAERIEIRLYRGRLLRILQRGMADAEDSIGEEGEDTVLLSIPAQFKRAGHELKLVLEGQSSANPDASLIKLMLQAHDLHRQLLRGDIRSTQEIGRRNAMTSSFVTRVMRVAFLAPDIVSAILKGRHPLGLNAAKLLRDSRLPLDWSEQRKVLGFG